MGSEVGKAGACVGDARAIQSSLFSFINSRLHSIITQPSPCDVTGKMGVVLLPFAKGCLEKSDNFHKAHCPAHSKPFYIIVIVTIKQVIASTT